MYFRGSLGCSGRLSRLVAEHVSGILAPKSPYGLHNTCEVLSGRSEECRVVNAEVSHHMPACMWVKSLG